MTAKAAALALLVAAGAAAAGARTWREGEPIPLMSIDEARAEAFPGATWRIERRSLGREASARVARRSGRPVEAGPVEVHVATRDGRTVGYGLVLEEVGLHHPITFFVAIGADGRVVDSLVLVYRESRGDEIRLARFRRQLKGLGLRDPIRINRDVIHITGATYSCRATTDVLRRALSTLDELGFLGDRAARADAS